MPRRLTAVLLTALLALAAAASPAAASDRCSPRGSKTVKQTASVRVFSVQRKRESRVYGCLRRTGRPVRLATTFDDSGLNSIRLDTVLIAGTSVALTTVGFEDLGPEGAEFEGLTIADLKRGGRVYRIGISTNDEDQYDGFAKVVLRRDGAAAWIVAGNGDYDEVDVLGATDERATPVAYAKGIDERSLALGGDGVTWTQNGATRTAAIP